MVPGEPAGWANWGILALRQRNYDLAAQRLGRARDLAPQNDRIYDLLGILESQRGQSAQAIADLRKAAELNPKNLRAIYRLAEETERQGDENGAAEVQQLLQKILAAQPDNLAALLELSRVAAKRGDAATLHVGNRPDQRPFGSLAAGGATSTCNCAGCRRRHRPSCRRHPNHISAQRDDASPRVSSEPDGDQGASRR